MLTPYYERDGCVIYHGDARDVLPHLDPVDCVITDPPYPKEYDSVWDILGDDVPHAMKDDTFLATLLGHYQLPRVVDALRRNLDYYWMAVTENNNCPIMHGFKVKVNYKPVLVFRKGKAQPRKVWRDRFNAASQVAAWKAARAAHKWGQSETLFGEPITAFSSEGETVLDPFMGGGTTLLVCRDLKRKAIGIEIEERYCEIAAKRLAQGVLF